MKTILNFRFSLICIGMCVCSLNMYGQWDDFSSHTDKEMHNNSRSIYLRGNPKTDLDGFEVLTKLFGSPASYGPFFQVNTNGRIAFGTPLGIVGHAYLDFLQQGEKFGSINTSGEDFHVDAVRRLWLSSRGHASLILDNKNVDLIGNLNVSVPGLTPNAKVSIYSGANNDPTLSAGQSNKWLRIGNDGGLALFGDDTYKQGDVSPTLKITTDWVNIKGNLKLMDGDVISYVGVSSDNTTGWLGTTSNHGVNIGTNNNTAMYVDPAGDIYI